VAAGPTRVGPGTLDRMILISASLNDASAARPSSAALTQDHSTTQAKPTTANAMRDMSRLARLVAEIMASAPRAALRWCESLQNPSLCYQGIRGSWAERRLARQRHRPSVRRWSGPLDIYTVGRRPAAVLAVPLGR